MIGESSLQHLDELRQKTETALTRLDALFTQQPIDCLHNARHLRLQLTDRSANPPTSCLFTASTGSSSLVLNKIMFK